MAPGCPAKGIVVGVTPTGTDGWGGTTPGVAFVLFPKGMRWFPFENPYRRI
jgi:hypothetical protein